VQWILAKSFLNYSTKRENQNSRWRITWTQTKPFTSKIWAVDY